MHIAHVLWLSWTRLEAAEHRGTENIGTVFEHLFDFTAKDVLPWGVDMSTASMAVQTGGRDSDAGQYSRNQSLLVYPEIFTSPSACV